MFAILLIFLCFVKFPNVSFFVSCTYNFLASDKICFEVFGKLYRIDSLKL